MNETTKQRVNIDKKLVGFFTLALALVSAAVVMTLSFSQTANAQLSAAQQQAILTVIP